MLLYANIHEAFVFLCANVLLTQWIHHSVHSDVLLVLEDVAENNGKRGISNYACCFNEENARKRCSFRSPDT